MSRREIYVCDCCGKEIPVVKRKDILGVERDKISLDLEVGIMNIIKNWFKDNGYKVDEYETTLQAKTDTILFLVVEPHDGTNGKWMLRVAALVSFDRWANSTAVEEFFDTETGLCNYLENNQLYIYKDVLRSLSEEYEEMYRVNYED